MAGAARLEPKSKLTPHHAIIRNKVLQQVLGNSAKSICAVSRRDAPIFCHVSSCTSCLCGLITFLSDLVDRAAKLTAPVQQEQAAVLTLL